MAYAAYHSWIFPAIFPMLTKDLRRNSPSLFAIRRASWNLVLLFCFRRKTSPLLSTGHLFKMVVLSDVGWHCFDSVAQLCIILEIFFPHTSFLFSAVWRVHWCDELRFPFFYPRIALISVWAVFTVLRCKDNSHQLRGFCIIALFRRMTGNTFLKFCAVLFCAQTPFPVFYDGLLWHTPNKKGHLQSWSCRVRIADGNPAWGSRQSHHRNSQRTPWWSVPLWSLWLARSDRKPCHCTEPKNAIHLWRGIFHQQILSPMTVQELFVLWQSAPRNCPWWYLLTGISLERHARYPLSDIYYYYTRIWIRMPLFNA